MRVLPLLLVLVAMPTLALGLSEEQAVERALAQPRVATLLEARIAAAEGAAASVGRWQNPEIEYSEESLDLSGDDSSERSFWLRQRFNPAGARGLERRAAGHDLAGQIERIELQRRSIMREIREIYYDVLAARQRLEAQRDWRDRLTQLAAAVEARRQAGDAARFDSVRLRQELALVTARTGEAQAEFDAVRDTLFALIDIEPVALNGGLLPPESYGPGTLEEHPTLRALRAEARGADTRAQAARRDAWPDVTLGVGRRELDDGDIDAEGGLIALGVELPLFERSQGQVRAAHSEARALRAEASLIRSRLTAEYAEARRLLAVRRAAVLDLKRELATEGTSLSAMAEAAYVAGEIDVMALIDAHRTELAMVDEITGLSRAARAAYIQLQYLSGEP